jgi:REP element-mobilizing transposase RayT
MRAVGAPPDLFSEFFSGFGIEFVYFGKRFIMANTFSKVLLHIVFRVGAPNIRIEETNRIAVEKYITGIVTKMGQRLLAIYCNPDHIHILVGFKPNINISELVSHVKVSSTKYINDNRLCNSHFRWQSGFGVFSCSQKDLTILLDYVRNQAQHHRTESFRSEIVRLLEENQVKYEERFLFDF